MANTTICRPAFDYRDLRGRIKTICGTEGEFARRIGRTHNFVSSVFCGKTYFEAKDIDNAVSVLDIDVADVGKFFYTHKVCETKL